MLHEVLEINPQVAIPSPESDSPKRLARGDTLGRYDGAAAAPDKEMLMGTKSSKTAEK